jgi:hypothetical protein
MAACTGTGAGGMGTGGEAPMAACTGSGAGCVGTGGEAPMAPCAGDRAGPTGAWGTGDIPMRAGGGVSSSVAPADGDMCAANGALQGICTPVSCLGVNSKAKCRSKTSGSTPNVLARSTCGAADSVAGTAAARWLSGVGDCRLVSHER